LRVKEEDPAKKSLNNYSKAQPIYNNQPELINVCFPVTAKNYLDLKDILDKRRTKLVCVQYPFRNIELLKRIFNKEGGVIFVDNQAIFKKALQVSSRSEYFIDFYAGDFGHCASKGNRLIAENIANVLLKEYFKK
jgi:hypothetical protein